MFKTCTKKCNENLQSAVMLTALLNSPDPDSHQYTVLLSQE